MAITCCPFSDLFYSTAEWLTSPQHSLWHGMVGILEKTQAVAIDLQDNSWQLPRNPCHSDLDTSAMVTQQCDQIHFQLWGGMQERKLHLWGVICRKMKMLIFEEEMTVIAMIKTRSGDEAIWIHHDSGLTSSYRQMFWKRGQFKFILLSLHRCP